MSEIDSEEVPPYVNRPEHDRATALALAVVEQNKAIEVLTSKIDGLIPATEVVERLNEVEKRVTRRSLGVVLLAFLLICLLGASGFLALRADQRRFAVGSCFRRNSNNQVIRDIVDKSQTQSFDYSKLSPAAQEILVEFAKAQQNGGQQSFRAFVYAKTPITDCSKLPSPWQIW